MSGPTEHQRGNGEQNLCELFRSDVRPDRRRYDFLNLVMSMGMIAGGDGLIRAVKDPAAEPSSACWMSLPVQLMYTGTGAPVSGCKGDRARPQCWDARWGA